MYRLTVSDFHVEYNIEPHRVKPYNETLLTSKGSGLLSHQKSKELAQTIQQQRGIKMHVP